MIVPYTDLESMTSYEVSNYVFVALRRLEASRSTAAGRVAKHWCIAGRSEERTQSG